MVDIYVGKERKHFRVHKSLLCKKVPYFDKMFNGNFQEAAKNQAEFAEDDVIAFDVLTRWIYTGSVRKLKFISESGDDKMLNINPYSAYCVADKFCLPQLMDRFMSAIMEFSSRNRTIAGPRHVKVVYEKTPESSPLRRFIVQQWFYTISRPGESDKGWNTMLKEIMRIEDFSGDFINFMQGKGGMNPEDPRKLPHCEFHHHSKEEDCPDKQKDIN